MFQLQLLLKQTNKKIPDCVCRLPHAHSSCLPTTESPGGEGTSTARSSQRRARLMGVSPPYQAPFAPANICFFTPGKERAATLEKTKPSKYTPNNFSHAIGLSIFQVRRPLSAPRAPQRALLPRLTKPPAPERCWTPRTCFFLLPKCTSTLSKHPRFSDAQGLCAQPAPPNPAEPKPKTQTTSS